MEFGMMDLGFWVWGLRFGFAGWGFGFGSVFFGSGFEVCLECGVLDLGVWVWGVGFWDFEFARDLRELRYYSQQVYSTLQPGEPDLAPLLSLK